MQRCLLAAAMNVALVGAASADPVPDVDPVHGQREDAQRLAQQHHDLVTAPPAEPPAPPAARVEVTEVKRNQRIAGWVLFTGGALLSAVALPALLYPTPASSSTPASDTSSANTFGLIAGLSAMVAGGVLIYTSRSVHVVPAVGSHAVGLAISGRL